MKVNHTSPAHTKKVDERPMASRVTTKLLERLKPQTKTEWTVFAMCVFYGTCMLIFKIIGA